MTDDEFLEGNPRTANSMVAFGKTLAKRMAELHSQKAHMTYANQLGYTRVSKPDHLKYVLIVKNDSLQLELTEFILDPQAFPCRFKIDGSDVVSNDLFSLERNLNKLIASAYAGDCFRRLME